MQFLRPPTSGLVLFSSFILTPAISYPSYNGDNFTGSNLIPLFLSQSTNVIACSFFQSKRPWSPRDVLHIRRRGWCDPPQLPTVSGARLCQGKGGQRQTRLLPLYKRALEARAAGHVIRFRTAKTWERTEHLYNIPQLHRLLRPERDL